MPEQVFGLIRLFRLLHVFRARGVTRVLPVLCLSLATLLLSACGSTTLGNGAPVMQTYPAPSAVGTRPATLSTGSSSFSASASAAERSRMKPTTARAGAPVIEDPEAKSEYASGHESAHEADRSTLVPLSLRAPSSTGAGPAKPAVDGSRSARRQRPGPPKADAKERASESANAQRRVARGSRSGGGEGQPRIGADKSATAAKARETEQMQQQIEQLNTALRDSQQRADEAERKLQALIDIDRSMAQRAPGSSLGKTAASP